MCSSVLPSTAATPRRGTKVTGGDITARGDWSRWNLDTISCRASAWEASSWAELASRMEPLLFCWTMSFMRSAARTTWSAPEDCCSTENDKTSRHVVDLQDDVSIGGTGSFLTIDAGTEDGVSPGAVFSVYRVMYPAVPTPRNVVGEATVVAVRERTATAKITYARKEIMVGDQVQLR